MSLSHSPQPSTASSSQHTSRSVAEQSAAGDTAVVLFVYQRKVGVSTSCLVTTDSAFDTATDIARRINQALGVDMDASVPRFEARPVDASNVDASIPTYDAACTDEGIKAAIDLIIG